MGYESSFRVCRPRARHRDLSREVRDVVLGAFNDAKRRPAVQLILGTVKHVECGTDFWARERILLFTCVMQRPLDVVPTRHP